MDSRRVSKAFLLTLVVNEEKHYCKKCKDTRQPAKRTDASVLTASSCTASSGATQIWLHRMI